MSSTTKSRVESDSNDRATPLVLRPIVAFESALMKQPPIKRCCCCCSTYCGAVWTTVMVMLEAFWTIGTSIARPTWEWNESAEQILSFALANLARCVSLPASAVLLVVALRSKAGVYTTCGFRDFQMMLGYFRVLCALVLVELVELILKFFDVHAVCNSPEVTLARNDSNYTGMTVEGCELFSNVYDFCIEVTILALLSYAAWATFSNYRYMSGRDKAPPHVPVHVTVIQSVSDLDSEKSRHSVEIENGKREQDTKPTVGDSFEVALDSPDDDEGDEVDEEVGSV